MLNILQFAPIFTAGISFYLTYHHISLFKRLGQQYKIYLSFAITCFLSGLYNIFITGLYTISEIEQAIFWQRSIFLIVQLYAMAFIWFIAYYIKYSNRKVLYGITFYFLGAIFLGIIDQWNLIINPKSIAIKEINLLPWLEVTYIEYSSGLFKSISGIIYIFLNLYFFWQVTKFYRRGNLQEARPLLKSFLIFFFAVGNDVAIVAEWYESIYLVEYAFLVMEILMTMHFLDHVSESIIISKSLKNYREQYRTIIEQMSDGFGILDEKYKFVYVNNRLCEMLEYSSLELIGRDIKSLFSEKSKTQFEYHLEFRKMGLKSSYELEWITKSGINFYTIIAGAPIIDDKGVYKGSYAIVTDIMAQKEIENKLNQAKISAEATDRAKSDFIANISHEFRTPLNAILGFSQLLLDDSSLKIDTDQRDQLETIYSSGKFLLKIINTTLDITKIESGKMNLSISSFSLRDTIKSIIEIFKPQLENKQIQIIFDSKLKTDLVITNDRIKLQQILSNLLSNAIKFAPNDGKIQIEFQRKDDNVEIKIKDSGMGIKQEDLPRLFQPFVQLEDPMVKSHEGTGLGLYLCKKLVELMKGKIWAESEYQISTTFYVIIPLMLKEIPG